MYHFLANSVEEKNQWYSELHKLILVQKHLFSKVGRGKVPSTICVSSAAFLVLWCIVRFWSCKFTSLLHQYQCPPPPQLLSHLSVPDESFCCVKVRAKVNYLGMLKDGELVALEVSFSFFMSHEQQPHIPCSFLSHLQSSVSRLETSWQCWDSRIPMGTANGDRLADNHSYTAWCM